MKSVVYLVTVTQASSSGKKFFLRISKIQNSLESLDCELKGTEPVVPMHR